MENLTDALLEQLRDLHSAESQLIEGLGEMADGAVSPDLSRAFKDHLKETKQQLARLDKIGKIVQEDLSGHTCKAMKGLIKESKEALEDDYESEELKDVQLVGCAQRIEHYEIAGYGNAIALAEFLGLGELVSLLKESIEEEGEANRQLTRLCESQLFEACDAGGEGIDASL